MESGKRNFLQEPKVALDKDSLYFLKFFPYLTLLKNRSHYLQLKY